jgi:dipeptide/tripeptide permease
MKKKVGDTFVLIAIYRLFFWFIEQGGHLLYLAKIISDVISLNYSNNPQAIQPINPPFVALRSLK